MRQAYRHKLLTGYGKPLDTRDLHARPPAVAMAVLLGRLPQEENNVHRRTQKEKT